MLAQLGHDDGVEASGDVELLEALRAGSEEAFRRLVLRHHQAMVRVARPYVTSAAVAEEVAQETWMGVLRGLEGFEGRSSLKTWIFTILINRARSRGKMEHRSIPITFLAPPDNEGGRSVDPGRFLGGDDPFDGSWRFPPARLSDPSRGANHQRRDPGGDRRRDTSPAEHTAAGRDLARRRGLVRRRGLRRTGAERGQPACATPPGACPAARATRGPSRGGGSVMTFDDLLCRDFVEMATDYVEGHLSGEARLVVELHLAFCSPCVEYLDQMRATIDISGKLHDSDIPEPVMESLLRGFRALKDQA